MNTPKVTPKDFFLWAGAMIALYSSVFAFIALLFQYIDYTYPDVLLYSSDPFSSGIRIAMATLIVMVPLAILLMRFIRTDIQHEPPKADLWVRRWVLVLTVFIAGFAAVGDLITLVNYFLGGDITTRFILKVVVLLLVALAVFLHFLADLRGYWTAQPKRAQIVGWASAIAVLIAIVAGFFIMGSPTQIRLYRFDAQKVSDLQNIQYQIVNFWQQKEKLPANLTDLLDPLSGQTIPVDPQTNQPYRYDPTGKMSFKLCAAFNADSSKEGGVNGQAVPVRPSYAEDNWQHGVGEKCFERTIDPQRYPPYSKAPPVVR